MVITLPALNCTDYCNCKGWYSIITQAVVCHYGLFRNLCIGWSSSFHDACVFSNSMLNTAMVNYCRLRIYMSAFLMDLICNDVTNKNGHDSWGTLYSQYWEGLAFRHDCRKETQQKMVRIIKDLLIT